MSDLSDSKDLVIQTCHNDTTTSENTGKVYQSKLTLDNDSL